MSVEHPICPHCEEPLDRMVEDGVAGLWPCTNSKCPGKRPDLEAQKSIEPTRPDAAKRAASYLDSPLPYTIRVLGLHR